MKTENDNNAKENSSAWNRAGTWEDKTLKKTSLQKVYENQILNQTIKI